jgi:hypothetical protein
MCRRVLPRVWLIISFSRLLDASANVPVDDPTTITNVDDATVGK